jgi:Lipid A 3-O-deacylase (PagL)
MTFTRLPRSEYVPFFIMRSIQLAVFSCCAVMVTALTVCCQSRESLPTTDMNPPTAGLPSNAGIQKRWNEFGVWGGISFDATTLIGKTPDAKFGNLGLRYGRVLLASKSVAFEWTIDAVPVAVLSNKRFVLLPDPSGGFFFALTRKSVYGWGAAPIGLKFNFRRNHRVEPFVHTTGGFLYFNEAVPESGAARFNFTFDFAGGVQIVNSHRRAFFIGYKYQHISNGDRTPINPGVDVQMINAGFSIFR